MYVCIIIYTGQTIHSYVEDDSGSEQFFGFYSEFILFWGFIQPFGVETFNVRLLFLITNKRNCRRSRYSLKFWRNV